MDEQQFLVMFPGQGSQKPGMSKDLVERFDEAAELWARADRALGFKLSQLALEGPADELTLTHNAQPALLVHSAIVWTLVRRVFPRNFIAAAGHSLGEFSAYFAAGSFDFETAIQLVRFRGEAMLKAGQESAGAMAAILGQTDPSIEIVCARTSPSGRVVAANYNSPEQVVISGEVEAVEAAMEKAKEAGAKRAVRLNVSGAFHSPLMNPAAKAFSAKIGTVPMRDPRIPVYSNVTAEATRDAHSAATLLVDQLTSPVRWVRLMETMCMDYPGVPVLEMGPGNVLCGLTKRIVPDAECIPLGTAAELDKFFARFAAA